MKTRLLSALLVFLLVASVSIPAVSADPAPLAVAAPAIPEVATIVIGTVTFVMTGVAALKIAENLGKTWDNTLKGWDQLMKDTGDALNNLFNAKKLMIDATSSKAEAVLEFEYYTASAGSGGKNDKLYHKAEWKNGKVKLDTKRISEKDAVKELKEGRDIFTTKKELAEKLVNRVSKENYDVKPDKFKEKERFEKIKDREIEKHGTGKGYYEHYHPKYQNTRPHCWFWRR